MAEVEIYYTKVCGLCTKAGDFFRERGIPFTAHELEWDQENDEFVDSDTARKMYQRCGSKVDFVPQIFIDDLHIPGWRKLEPMIQSGEIDHLLA